MTKQNTQKQKRQILVTAALPYANAPLHLGYMLETIQSDIWVRFQKLIGNTCYFVCGDDAHGTPIMLKAESLNLTPEELIGKIHQEHVQTLKDFSIGFDNFYTTHSPENRQLANELYKKLVQKGDIEKRNIHHAFDPVKNMFLPDRYVKGECPKCHTKDQYGDSCEVCGSTYSPMDLINPVSTISGATPIEKESLHYFFCLEHYEAMLKEWINQDHLQPEVSKKLSEWFETGLQQWDISRDDPYFGFEIPDAPNKYFYVWLDAPIGYMASFKNFCDKQNSSQDKDKNKETDKDKNNDKTSKNIKFEDFWGKDSQAEVYHFIGKDIIYFHGLFWPALLYGGGYRTPTGIIAHGFVMINGQKMSKSRGTFILGRTYLNYFKPDYLRYYFASKLGNSIEDIDLQFEDFVQRVNSDLVGKLVNIASRSAKFINERFHHTLAPKCSDLELYEKFVNAGDAILNHFENREFSHAVREIMSLADSANRYIDEKKPWNLIKLNSEETLKEAHEVTSLGLNLFRLLMIYLKPIVPVLAKEVEEFLNTELSWENRTNPLLNHIIQPFKPLLQRIEISEVNKMLESQKENPNPFDAAATSTPSSAPSSKSRTESGSTPSSESKSESSGKRSLIEETPLREVISIDDFAKVDLRIAKILDAEEVEGADKLLKLTIDIGGQTRQIFAGIKKAYQPKDLIGKLTVVVANLAPRKMRFGVSEGMVAVAVSPTGDGLWLLEPQEGALPGMRVQ